MHDVETLLLKAFRKDPEREWSTSELVSACFPETRPGADASGLGGPAGGKNGREKGVLHRRLLYHLNRLVGEGVLKIAHYARRGEKCFALVSPSTEVRIERRGSTVVIARPPMATPELDAYQNLFFKFDEHAWATKVNGLLVFARRLSGPQAALAFLRGCYGEVNDVIGLHDFEMVLNHAEPDALSELVERLTVDTLDFGRAVNFIVDLDEAHSLARLKAFAAAVARAPSPRLAVIWRLSPLTLVKRAEVFKAVVAQFRAAKVKLHVQAAGTPPCLIGTGGVHTADAGEWPLVLARAPQLSAVALSQNGLALDADEFSRRLGSARQLETLLFTVAKVLLRAENLKRRQSFALFPALHRAGGDASADVFKFTRSYLRIWNYDFERHEAFFAALASLKGDLDEYCFNQETIYKSCGIPMRFRIALSSSFRTFSKSFARRAYHKESVRGLASLRSPKSVATLRRREWLSTLFDGGDRVRFFRDAPDDDYALVQEIQYLLHEFSLPLVTYDFRPLRGDFKLTAFFDHGNP